MSQYTLSYTGEEVNNLLTTVSDNHDAWDSISQVPDRIVSQGTSGIWSYVKYDNGWAMCWGRYGIDDDITQTWGSWYFHSEHTMPDYPFSFTSNPCFIPFKENGSEGVIIASGKGSTTAPPSLYLVRPNSYSAAYYEVMMLAIGQWK